MAAENLKNIIENYLAEAETVAANAKPFEGAFGMKGGLANDPCHMKFYNAMAEAVKYEEPYEAVRTLLEADSSYDCPKSVRFMLTAIQGLAIDLVPALRPEQKEEFRAWYDRNIPKRMRLPIQAQLYKALKD